MNPTVKMTGALHETMLQDLRRPHPFAYERVGFAFGRLGSLTDSGKSVLLTRYHSVLDDHYIDDPTVGACIGQEAMIWAMQEAYLARDTQEGIFHVHLHDLNGEPKMSGTDRNSLPNLIPGFRAINRQAAHGILILSRNHGSAWIWLPGEDAYRMVNSINVIGMPVQIFKRKKPK